MGAPPPLRRPGNPATHPSACPEAPPTLLHSLAGPAPTAQPWPSPPQRPRHLVLTPPRTDCPPPTVRVLGRVRPKPSTQRPLQLGARAQRAPCPSPASRTRVHQPRDLRADHAQLQPVGQQQRLLRRVYQEGCGQRLLLRKPDVQQSLKLAVTSFGRDNRVSKQQGWLTRPLQASPSPEPPVPWTTGSQRKDQRTSSAGTEAPGGRDNQLSRTAPAGNQLPLAGPRARRRRCRRLPRALSWAPHHGSTGCGHSEASLGTTGLLA